MGPVPEVTAVRELYDSTNPLDIPTTAQMVAGYVDGIYGPQHARFNEPGWDALSWARFPNAVHVGIAISASTNAGEVLDVETFDATPAQAPGWGRMRQRAGLPVVTFYVNRSNRNAVEQALHAAGFAPNSAVMWVSTLDNTKTVPPSFYGYKVVAVQFAGSNLSGGHYDLSVVADYWPGVDSVNKPSNGGLIMDPDVNKALRKIALNTAAAAAGASTADADLNPVWEVIATDFSNLGDVTAQYLKAKGGAKPTGTVTIPAGTKLTVTVD